MRYDTALVLRHGLSSEALYVLGLALFELVGHSEAAISNLQVSAENRRSRLGWDGEGGLRLWWSESRPLQGGRAVCGGGVLECWCRVWGSGGAVCGGGVLVPCAVTPG